VPKVDVRCSLDVGVFAYLDVGCCLAPRCFRVELGGRPPRAPTDPPTIESYINALETLYMVERVYP